MPRANFWEQPAGRQECAVQWEPSVAPAATLQTAARPGTSSPGPGALPSPEGLGLLHIFHRAATAANSKELSLPPEPVVPWPLTLNLTETQGSPAASQPGVGRKDGCEPDVPGLAPLPTFAHFCESTGSLQAECPQLQHPGSGEPSTASHSAEQGAHTKASLRKCASHARGTSTARTSPRGLC